VLFGSFLFIYQYLQLVLGLSPLMAGVVTLPSFAAFVLGSMLAPVFVKRTAPAYVMAGGLALAAVGLLGLTQLTPESGLGILIGSSFVYSLGIAPVFTLTNDLILGAAPPEKAGAASGISETGAELGGALSIAVLGTIGIAVYRAQVEDSIPASVPPEEAEVAQDTLGGAVAVSGELTDALASQMLDAARLAFTQGLQVVALVSAVIAALSAIGVMAFLRGVRAAPHEQTEAAAATAAVESP
jgi:DHA2 family multidrug resistance protein-like MFS transporter